MYWIALQQAQPEAPGPASAGAGGQGHSDYPPAMACATTALGWWALQFTPKVALLEQAVVLEVSASERLFGGRQQLLDQLARASRPAGPIKTARAPTALVALALLQLEGAAARAPDQLPLATLADARPHLATLERLGCYHWGDVRALPRAGVARRFGAALLDALDRAYGLKPEVYPWLELPEVFDMPLELAAQVETAPALMFAARRLLLQLQAWLQARKQGVLALELSWEMDARRNTAPRGQLVVRTAEPTLDMQHLQRLLAEHLAHTTLPAPVLYLRLRSLAIADLPGANASLLPDELRSGDSLQHLLERLSARLGPQQVLRVLQCADHRPERKQRWVAASRHQPVAGRSIPLKKRRGTEAAPAARDDGAWYPGWLLATPLKLDVAHDCPLYQGPLTLLAGPQRLEAGWWDGVHASDAGAGAPATRHADPAPGGRPGMRSPATLRDYFLARSEQAGLLWVYRERLATRRQPSGEGGKEAGEESSHWYLHGLFA